MHNCANNNVLPKLNALRVRMQNNIIFKLAFSLLNNRLTHQINSILGISSTPDRRNFNYAHPEKLMEPTNYDKSQWFSFFSRKEMGKTKKLYSKQ